jgi:hypothetical protein
LPNFNQSGWTPGWLSAVDPNVEQSGLLTHIAATESVSLCTPMKSSLRFWNWKEQFVSTF